MRSAPFRPKFWMLFGTGGGRDPGLLHWIDEVDAFAALTAAVLRDPGPGVAQSPLRGSSKPSTTTVSAAGNGR